MAGTVNTQLPLPQPNAHSVEAIFRTMVGWANTLVQQLLPYGVRINLCLPKDGSEAMTGPLPLVTYTTATKPSAVGRGGQIIYVSDGGAGNVYQGSNGTSWVSLG